MNPSLELAQFLFWIAVAAVSISSASRITRLVTYDSFPPVEAVREWYGERAPGKWALLMFCGYCFGFWAYGLVLVTGYLSDWHLVWWLLNAWFAGGYWAAILMSRDGED